MTHVRTHGMALVAIMAGLLVLAGCGSGGGTPPELPVVGTVTPHLGPKEGGTLLTVTGSGFTEDMVVTLAEQPVVGFTFIDANTFTCTTPAVPGGTRAGVIVKNGNGVTFKLDVFFFIPAPEVKSVTPNFGKPEGLVPVTITGKGFTEFNAGPNTVIFGTAPATNVVTASDTVITCVIPAGNGPTNVTVTNLNGTGELKNAYRYFPPPTVGSVLPNEGTPLGGTSIVVKGTGYTSNNPGAPMVLVGGRAASNIAVVNDTTITCDTPDGTPGPADVEVSNSNGSSVATGAFNYYPYPTVSAVTPDNGSQEGGIPITITGTGFFANAAGVNSVTLGGVPCTSIVVQNDTTITCVSPATGAGPQVVEVTNNNGSGSLAAAYHANLVALIGSDGPNLYVIDTNNGNTTNIGAIGFTVKSMACSPSGVVYAVTTAGDLITIATATGAGTKVATLSNTPTDLPGDLTFFGTRLIGANYWGEVYEINTTNGSMTRLPGSYPYWAFTGPGWRQAIEYDYDAGVTLYTPGSTTQWLSITPDTGSYGTNSWSSTHHATAVLAYFKGVMYMSDVGAGSNGANRTFYKFDAGYSSSTTIGGTSLVAMTGTR